MHDYILEDAMGSRGPPPTRFILPAAVASLQPSNDLALAEAGANRVTILTPSGQFRRVLAAPLSAERFSSRPLRSPSGVADALDGESIIVADTHNHRLLRMLVADGSPVANATFAARHFGAPRSALRSPRGLASHVQWWPPYGRIPVLCPTRSARTSDEPLTNL